MSTYKPPLTITDEITVLVSEISEEVGRISVLQEGHITPQLRRKNRIRTIHSSLAIENNTLSIDQVSGRSGTHMMLTSSCWSWILFLLMTC